jgi:hypothetical protein
MWLIKGVVASYAISKRMIRSWRLARLEHYQADWNQAYLAGREAICDQLRAEWMPAFSLATSTVKRLFMRARRIPLHMLRSRTRKTAWLGRGMSPCPGPPVLT